MKTIKCPNCQGETVNYGLAPHKHIVKETENNKIILGTILSKEPVEDEKWGFDPDPEDPSCGVYYCKVCRGSGRVEQQLKIVCPFCGETGKLKIKGNRVFCKKCKVYFRY